jgi:hypothetical protein
MRLQIKYTSKKLINDESGFALSALLAVFGVLAVITTLAVVLLPLSQNDTSQTSRETASTKSFYIAEAGINNYLWHINRNSDYFYEESHTAQGVDAYGNDNWASYESGQYHLDIAENTTSPGFVVQATGRIQENGITTTRQIKAVITMKSFTQYVYFTDTEHMINDTNPIWFISGESIRGPLRTNDYVHIYGNPSFYGLVSTNRSSLIYSDGWNDHYVTPPPTSRYGNNPNFYDESGNLDANSPKTQVGYFQIPATNDSLKIWASSAYNNGTNYCYYGRTKIKLLSSGQIEVTNNNPSNTGVTGTVNIPTSGVIYVDGNTTPPKTSPTDTEKYGTANHNNGDVFVKGTLRGRLTVAAKNDIFIFGNITYNNTTANSTDMLGLIADNSVLVLHKWSDDVTDGDINLHGDSPYTVNTVLNNLEIRAAILTVNNSFGYEQYSTDGTRQNLYVTGSIAQKYRGAVGQGSNGYIKQYTYDTRMRYKQPPHFLAPANSGYQVVSWEEVK